MRSARFFTIYDECVTFRYKLLYNMNIKGGIHVSITTYIIKLRDEKDISFMQLAKDMDITYANMMDLKNGRISFPSRKLLHKISKYENRPIENILEDILIDDLDPIFSKRSLKYLCAKYIDDYSVIFEPNYPNHFKSGQLYFSGLITKKRYSNSYILVDSWESLKKEHWKSLRISNTTEYNNDAFSKVFVNEQYYIASVIAYAIQKATRIANTNPGIRGYHILFNRDKERFDYENAKMYLTTILGFKIELINVPY